MKTLRCLPRLGSAALAFALSQTSSGVTVFSDTYEYSGTPNPQTNLATEIATRQAGGTTASTYTEQIAGPVANDAALNVDNGLDVLRLRTTNPSTGASQAAVDLNTNFAPTLANKIYTVTFNDLWFTRGTVDITDVWFALSVGDTSPSISGPNNAQTDFGLLLRAQGSGHAIWRDNSNTGGAFNLTGSGADYGFSTRYQQVVMTIDETAGIANATGKIDVTTANGTFSSPVFNFGFDNVTDRYFEFRAHQNSTGTDGQFMDVRIGSVAIDVIPEPSSACIGAFGLLLLLRRRR